MRLVLHPSPRRLSILALAAALALAIAVPAAARPIPADPPTVTSSHFVPMAGDGARLADQSRFVPLAGDGAGGGRVSAPALAPIPLASTSDSSRVTVLAFVLALVGAAAFAAAGGALVTTRVQRGHRHHAV